MRVLGSFALGLLLTIAPATTAWPADSSARARVVYDTVLRSGFTLHYDHLEKLQGVTRLYLSADPSGSFMDVPTEEIVSIDRQEIPAPLVPPRAVASPPVAAPKETVTDEELDRCVNSASDQHLVDRDLIRSVIKAESGFNPRAVSAKGANGLMQLMPQTASQLGVKDAFAPCENIEAGTRYLRDLLTLYNNNVANALAAYNAGTERVAQYNGVPPYHETRAYVARVIKDFNRTKRAARAADRQNGKAVALLAKPQKMQPAVETKPQARSEPTAPVAN